MVVLMGSPLGDRVRHLRELRDLTQGQVEEYTGLGRSWLSLVEAGDIKNPGGLRLDKLARFYGVSTHHLLTGEPDGETPNRLIRLEQLRQFTDDQLETLVHLGHTVFLKKMANHEPESGPHAKGESDSQPDAKDHDPELGR